MKRSRSTLYRRAHNAEEAEIVEPDVPEQPVSLLASEEYSQPVYEGSQLKVILVVLLFDLLSSEVSPEWHRFSWATHYKCTALASSWSQHTLNTIQNEQVPPSPSEKGMNDPMFVSHL